MARVYEHRNQVKDRDGFVTVHPPLHDDEKALPALVKVLVNIHDAYDV